MPWPWSKKDTPKTESQIQEMITSAVKEYAANSGSSEGMREMFSQALSGTYDGADTLHNVYLDYGYPDTVNFNNMWNMYRRFGVAKNVVELPVDIGWSSPPIIKFGEGDKAAASDEFEKLIDRLSMWQRMKGLDTRQRVGRYAGMFMRVRDGKSPDTPLEGSLSTPEALMSMVPLYESQLKVVSTEEDPTSDNFGNPTMYQMQGGVTGSRNENATQSFQIHPSRIVIAAEGADNGSIYGIPILESVYNSLMDLRKVIGGGAEGFYKNAAQSIILELMDGASSKIDSAMLKKFNEKFDDFMRNRFRRGFWAPGMKVSQLQSTLINPKEFAAAALSDVAAGAQIPATILIGQQTGRLASDEDSSQFLGVVQSRRENFMTQMIRDVIDWMMGHGIIKIQKYVVEWDDLLASSDEDKLSNAQKLATINESQFKSGGRLPFDAEEIREAGGYEPEELPEDEGEDLPDDDDLDDGTQ